MNGFASGAVPAIVGGAAATTQEILPNETLDAGGWVDELGGTTNLHLKLADESAATYVQSPASPVNATLKLGLGDFTPGSGAITIEIDTEQGS